MDKRKARPRKGDLRSEKGSGNVFADLGLPDAELYLAKAELTILIERHIKRLKLSSADAAARIGVSEEKLADLMRGRTTKFSLKRLFDGWTRLLEINDKLDEEDGE